MPRRGKTVQREQKDSPPSISLRAQSSLSISLRAQSSPSISLRALSPQPFRLRALSPHQFNPRSLSPQRTIQASGTEPSPVQPSGTEPSITQTSGTELSPVQPSGTEPSLIQPSGNQAPLSLTSGEQAPAPLPLVQPLEATGPEKATSSPMPSFTSQGPGAARIASPVKGATFKTPTITHVDEITCPVQLARLKDIAEWHRNGTWDGIPRGMSLVVDSDGNGRLKRNTADEGANKSKDIQKSKGITAL